MVYGDVGLREVGDIDLLIDPADAESADEVLRQSGLIRKEPAARLTPRRRDFYEKYFKDYTYEVTGGTSGFEVDLHWRLVRDAHAAHSLLADGSNALSNFEILKIGSMEVTVLTRERSLIYMAVHGATEGWARWKSLADIAALWVSVTQEQRLAVWGAAKTAGHTGFLRSALALATDWMGSFAEDSDADELSKTDDALEDYICTYARRRMIESHSLPSPGGQTTYAMKQHEARLYPAPSSRAALMMRVLFRPRLWEVVNLPDRLFFLYPVLSPVEWLYFRSRRWIHQKLRKDVPA
jgi:hypothetical protein